MKKKPKKVKSSFPENKVRQTVRFALRRGGAHSVAVAGSFNDWQTTTHRMAFDGKDAWQLELLLPPGTYEYRFIVDGEWCDDPAAILRVSNPFGGENAVRVVELPARATFSGS